jgi:CDGSH-type Zn-finger protein
MSDVTITINEDGPYLVDGDVRITDEHGRELNLPYDVDLCCREVSRNQSLCDSARAAVDIDGTLAN